MRPACPECGMTVGHYETCTLTPPPPTHPVGAPLLWDALMTTDRRMTWTA